ncbi:hypothetical protein ACA910_017981 [Epithemia clementina (nom. ined.)]
MSTIVARGPIQSALAGNAGQWMALGAGAIALFPDRLDRWFGTNFEKAIALAFAAPGTTHSTSGTSGPIIIHTGNSSDNNGSTVVTTIMKYGCGAGTIWIAYMVAASMLPDWAKDMLPVSRKFFDRAVTNLGKGILNVKDVLSKQIFNLSQKQDDLSKKQDETHLEVVNIQSELGEARQDLMEMSDALGRCEGQLETAERLQIYTSRGVKLLVRCVASVMPGNDRIMSELLQFTKEGEKFQQDKNNNVNTKKIEPFRSETQKEIMKLTAEPTYEADTITIKPSVDIVSPENEHPTRKEYSEEGLQELMTLIRDGKIQSLVHA